MSRTEKTAGRLALAAMGLLLILLGVATPGWGQKEEVSGSAMPPGASREAGSAKAEVPLRISAARLEADQDKRLIVFSGGVKAEYGDGVLYADKLLVFYEPPKGGPAAASEQKNRAASPLGELGGEKLERLEAHGNVRFVQGDRVATGDQAVYQRKRDEIVLLGRPQVWRGENHLRGSRITFQLKSRKVVVESSPPQRVEAYLYQAGRRVEPAKGLLPGSSRPKGPQAAPPSGRP